MSSKSSVGVVGAARLAAMAVVFMLPIMVGFAMARACPHDACGVLRARGEPSPQTFRDVWIVTYVGLGLVGARLVYMMSDRSARAEAPAAALVLWAVVQLLGAAWVASWGCECDPVGARTELVANIGVALALALALTRVHMLSAIAVALHIGWLVLALIMNQDVVAQLSVA